MTSTPPKLLLAVDVGTLSARAGLFDLAGRLLATAAREFPLLRPAEHHAVYRMDDIWAAVEEAIRACLAAAGADAAGRVAALAFDATSSLALSYEGPPPLAGEADVFCWMDHRGEAEAEEIGASGDRLLAYTGSSMSPEMHTPKLAWLARRDPQAFARVTGARDLCDELARRATGEDRHSLCGLACKWAYLPADAEPWRHELLARLGLGRLPQLGALAAPPLPVGHRHGRVTEAVAARLGLPTGIPVAVGLIDAEAGTLGVLGRGFAGNMNRTVALIGGTSTCYMAFAPDERRISGVWGPFRDAVFPGYWMHEAGQSLAGAALDAGLAHHPGGPRRASADEHAAAVRDILAFLEAEGPAFAARRHLVPDFLGNRAPLGDGSVRAILVGVGEDTSRRAFLETYYATARSLALQARHIIEHLNAHGYALDRVALSGGHLRNPLMVRLYRDALGDAALVLSDSAEPVLLGTAMVAAVGAGLQPDLFAALDAMAPAQESLAPDPRWRAAHEAAYGVYLKLFAFRNDIEREAKALAASGQDR